MSVTKICKDCSLLKELILFNKNPNGILKVEPRCKVCQSLYNKKYRADNKESISLQRKLVYQENKEQVKLNVSNYKKNNPEKVTESKRKSYLKNRKTIIKKTSAYRKKRYNSDPLFKLISCLRHRLNVAMVSKKWNKNTNFYKYTDCSKEDLQFWLEFWFEEGMNWTNHGKKEGQWSIDHIIPLSLAKTDEEMYKLCHYTNLQPMWHIDNIKKGNRV